MTRMLGLVLLGLVLLGLAALSPLTVAVAFGLAFADGWVR